MKGYSFFLIFLIAFAGFYAWQISPSLAVYNDDTIEVTITKPTFGETIFNDQIEIRWEFFHFAEQQSYARLIVSKEGEVVFDYTNTGYETDFPKFWFVDKNVNLDGDGDYIFELICGYYVAQGSGDYAVKSKSFPLTLVSPQQDTTPPPIPSIVEAYHIGETDPRRTWVKATDLWRVDDMSHYIFWWGSSTDYDNSSQVPLHGYVIEGTDQFEPMHVAVSAVDIWGNESEKSADFVVVDTVIDPPQPPNPPDIPEDPEDPSNSSPVASFTMNKTSFVVGEVITCKSWSYDPNGDTIAHRWFFDGDEVTSFGQRVLNMAPSLAYIVIGTEKKYIQHEFEIVGTHIITLEVSDSYFTKSMTRSVEVFGEGITDDEIGESPPPTTPSDWSTEPVVTEKKSSLFDYLRDPLFLMVVVIIIILLFYQFVLRRKK